MLSTIGTVVVFVADMARAKRFYAGTLGSTDPNANFTY